MAVIEIGGIGYEVNIPVTTTEKLPRIGEETKLYTLAIYREDSTTLYGFHDKEDREFFRLLVEKVSGIGPKIALSILSRLSVPILKNAILAADAALLSKCPGIGKKTAERLIIELKDKVGAGMALNPTSESVASGIEAAPIPGTDTRLQDAVTALMTLGYKATEADKSVRKALAKLDDDASTEALIKAALK